MNYNRILKAPNWHQKLSGELAGVAFISVSLFEMLELLTVDVKSFSQTMTSPGTSVKGF